MRKGHSFEIQVLQLAASEQAVERAAAERVANDVLDEPKRCSKLF